MPVITFSPQPYNEPVMIEGYGAQPVPPPPANDNVAQPVDESCASAGFGVRRVRQPMADVLGDWFKTQRGQYIGLTRPLSSDGGQQGGYDIPPALQPAFLDAARHGDFMQTATGRKFWPLDPKPEEVFIEDIAHGLSLQCRYAGHCVRFYSVAEHCVLMARKLRWEGVDVALWALLHDAAEAYTVDVPRPLKRSLVGYKEAEAKVMAAIATRYGLAADMPAVVHDADNRIIGDELANLVPMPWHDRYTGQELGVELRYWSPEKAEEEFMATFDALMDNRARVMA